MPQMKRPSENECIVLVDKGEVVTFKWEDGSSADMPRDVVAQSTLLHAALSDATPGDEFELSLGSGLLQQWLHAVSDEPYLLQMLQAIANLPDNLVQAILKASTRTIKEQLAYLPEFMRTAAIHAAFPCITQHGGLHISDFFDKVSLSHMDLMWQHLSKIPQLTKLNLCDDNLNEGHFDEFLKHLGSMTSLRSLDLGYRDLEEEDQVARLMAILGQLPNLKDLKLTTLFATIISIDGVSALAAGMSNLSNLQKFTLKDLDMPLDGPQQLISSMAQHLTSLQSLDLHGSSIQYGGVDEFVAQLTKLSMLNELCLGGIKFDEPEIPTLGREIIKLHPLTALRLDDIMKYTGSDEEDSIQVTAIREFTRCLSQFTGLLDLDLSCNHFEKVDGIYVLMQNVSILTTLRRLNLTENNASDRGIQKTLTHFMALTNLQMLGLGTSDSDSPSVDVLMPLVRDLPSLQVISVGQAALAAAPDAHKVFQGPFAIWTLPAE